MVETRCDSVCGWVIEGYRMIWTGRWTGADGQGLWNKGGVAQEACFTRYRTMESIIPFQSKYSLLVSDGRP